MSEKIIRVVRSYQSGAPHLYHSPEEQRPLPGRHEIAGQDFRLVTRPAQNNDTQRWELASVGAVYTNRLS